MRLLTFLGAGMLFVGSADAARLFLDSDGKGSVDLAPGQSAAINIMLTIRDIDPGYQFANVYLNDDDQLTNGEIDVTAVSWRRIRSKPGLVDRAGQCRYSSARAQRDGRDTEWSQSGGC